MYTSSDKAGGTAFLLLLLWDACTRFKEKYYRFCFPKILEEPMLLGSYYMLLV